MTRVSKAIKIAKGLLELLNETLQIVEDKDKEIQDLKYKLKVSEAKLSSTKRLLAESEKQRTKALELLDTNEYRN